MKTLIAGALILVCSCGTMVNAASNSILDTKVHYRQAVPALQEKGSISADERRRLEDEKQRPDQRWRPEEKQREEERRRQEEKQREEERQRQEEKQREDERRRQEEQQRQDERRRQEEKQREEERWRREEQQRQDERRRQEEKQREEERRSQEEKQRQDKRRKLEALHKGVKIIINAQDKRKAKETLRVTDERLIDAQTAARRGNYRFGLGKAYAHQEEARQLYNEKKYQQAMDHSMRAREIAQDVIDGNRPGRLARPKPHDNYDNSLDNELSIKVRDDKAILSLKITLD